MSRTRTSMSYKIKFNDLRKCHNNIENVFKFIKNYSQSNCVYYLKNEPIKNIKKY